MCRLAAYIGDAIPLENTGNKPKHSLPEQSQDAQDAKLAVNGDGFGLVWYDDKGEIGVYKDVLPAWSNDNKTGLCRVVKSGKFTASARASTSGSKSRDNCHPFTFENWAFAHNGGIARFEKLRRKVENLLSDENYSARIGSTDSGLFFFCC